MIGWIIFFSILAKCAMLLLSSLKITLEIGENAVFKVRFLFFKIVNYDSENKSSKSKKEKKKPNKKEKTLVDSLKEYASSKNKRELFFEIIEYLKIVLSKFKKLLSKTRFKKAVLDLTVATEDAADTAILYGKVCSAVYPIISILDTAMKFDPKRISVKTDFASNKMKLYLSGIIKIRFIHILGFLTSTALSIIILKLGDINNGKQPQH